MSIPSSAPAHQTHFGSPGLLHSLGSSPRRTRDGLSLPSSYSRLSLATRECVIVESDEEHGADEHGSTGKIGFLAGLGRGGACLSETTKSLPAPLPLSTPLRSPPFRKHPPSPLALHCLSSSFPPHSADEMCLNAPSSTSSSASSQTNPDEQFAEPPSSAGILPSMTSLARERLGLCAPPSNDELLSTRSRAMGQLSDALERRLAKDKPLSPSTLTPRAPLVLAGGTINTKRDERKALGLRAAVGSYKKRAASQSGDQSGSDSSGPPSPPSPPETTEAINQRPQNPSSGPPSPPSATSTTPTSIYHPSHLLLTQPMVSHSQYLAARRESIMQRVGGHRRVVSETLLSNRKPASVAAPPRAAVPSAAPLPSLDQIRSWAAQRKSTMSDYVYPRPSSSRPNPMSPSHSPGPASLGSPRPKSKQIYSHARDPSIPQICLSPDSDDEAEPAPGPAKPPVVASRPLSPQPDALAEAILSPPGLPAPRAEQRQFLLRNLAQAQQRRSGRSNAGASIVVAPV